MSASVLTWIIHSLYRPLGPPLNLIICIWKWGCMCRGGAGGRSLIWNYEPHQNIINERWQEKNTEWRWPIIVIENKILERTWLNPKNRCITTPHSLCNAQKYRSQVLQCFFWPWHDTTLDIWTSCYDVFIGLTLRTMASQHLLFASFFPLAIPQLT